MASYGRDYREDYGYGFPMGARERGHWGRPGMGSGWEGQRAFGPYDSPYRDPGPRARADRSDLAGRFGYRYGADYQRNAYDRGYKSRWQTDYGDPYGDRARHTPMRMVREEPRGYPGFDRYGGDFDRYPYPISERSFGPRGGYDADFGIRRGRLPYEQTGWTWPL